MGSIDFPYTQACNHHARANDNVSDVIYASDFTCGDFAEALVGRAYNTGYDLKVYSMFDSDLDDFKRYVESLEYVRKVDGGTITTTFVYGYGSGHAVCKAEIGSDTYLIEPQRARYFGEVTK